MVKKVVIPSVAEILARKLPAVTQKWEPPWIYLEREMRANVDKKPYNQKVGDWLSFLKDYKAFQREEDYDMNSMLMMSALLAIDQEDCIDALNELTKFSGLVTKTTQTPAPKPKRPRTAPARLMTAPYLDYKPKSPYLSKLVLPPLPPKKPPKQKAEPFDYKYKLRSNTQLEAIRHDEGWKKVRIRKLIADRSPSPEEMARFEEILRKKREQKMNAKLNKAKGKKSESFSSLEKKSQHFEVAGVVMIKGNPYYHKESLRHEPPDFRANMEEPKQELGKCNCMKYASMVKGYLQRTKCTCEGHLLYDFEMRERSQIDVVPPDNFFHPATKYGTYWFDDAEIFSLEQGKEDFIRKLFEDPFKCDDSESSLELVTEVAPSSNLLAAMLADLGKTRLIVPHLPQAQYLKRLLLWLKTRIKGKGYTEQEIKLQQIRTRRRWLWLDNLKFRTWEHMPFTYDEIHAVDWSYRDKLGKIFQVKLKEYTISNRLKQFEHARLFFPTMTNYDQKFLDVFYIYIPNRVQDTYFLEMHGSKPIRRNLTEPCPVRQK